MRFDYTQYWDAQKRLRPRTESIELTHENVEDHILRCVEESGTFYEVDLLEYAAACGPRGGVFLDVGANIGNHTVYFAKFLADAVIAVEPSPKARRCLRRNLALNGIENCTIAECAAGEKLCTAELVLPLRLERNLGGSRVRTPSRPTLAAEPVAVEAEILVRPLDDIVQEAQLPAGARVSLVKIDVEGMETAVLNGAQEVLETHTPDICTEVWNDANRDAVSALLVGLGYHCTHVLPLDTPCYWFVHDSQRQARRESGWFVRKLVASWSRGRLSRLRRVSKQPALHGGEWSHGG